RRCVRGTSDPVGLQCSCSSGSVILFYEYSTVSDPGTTAADLRKFCLELDLYGKVRIATEGVNVTLGGSTSAIEKFRAGVSSVLPLLQHIDPMDDAFFKPGQGCKHCFTDLSVKIVDEICPFGGRNPLSMRTDTGKEGIGPRITGLTPQKFHQELSNLADDKDTIVIDVRNYYESRIGFFENAVRPAIRRFSSFADWVDENCDTLAGKRIFTYCTGGIRCEKGAAYILDKVGSEVYMLDGGIHAYLEWAAKETSQPCLFKGANYVFDARLNAILVVVAQIAMQSAVKRTAI
ncbi:MAG: hypothetical protein SGCHY_001802, partial [Lobulomycetales sp.]